MDTNECCICMETLQVKNLAVTSCGHKFCLNCLLVHYKTKNNCPLCRQELVKNKTLQSQSQYHRVIHEIEDDSDDSDESLMYYQVYAVRIAEADIARDRNLQLRRREREQAVASRNQRRHGPQRRCGLCREQGHNRLTCPTINESQRSVF